MLDFLLPVRHRIPAMGTKFKIATVLVALAAGLIAFAINGSMEKTLSLRHDIAHAEADNAALQQTIAEDKREIAAATTTTWVEEQARQLGFVFPGERVFLMVPRGTDHPASGGVSAPLLSEQASAPPPQPTPQATVQQSAAPPTPAPSATPIVIAVP